MNVEWDEDEMWSENGNGKGPAAPTDKLRIIRIICTSIVTGERVFVVIRRTGVQAYRRTGV